MNKAVFLDRDGIINYDKNYLYKVEDFEFIPGVINGLKTLQEAGFLLIIITNQSGVARGYFDEKQLNILHEYMLNELKKQNVYISDILYCPHHPEALIKKYKKICNCRKPKTGLFYEAINKWNIDIDNSFAIGDNVRDCSICNTSECHGFIVNTSIEQSMQLTENGITVVNSFNDAVNIITR